MMRSTRLVIACGCAVLFTTAIPRGQAPAIQTIEINQAIGVQKNGALKFVAGKDTVVRAFLAAPVTIDPNNTSATMTRDGAMVVRLAPNTYTAPTGVVDFLCPSREACGKWAPGSYVFNVTVNGAAKTTAGTTYAFVERRPLRVLALPVKANYKGTITQVRGDSWKHTAAFVRRVFPVAVDRFTWTERSEFDASAAKYDLETDAGQRELWEALTNLMPKHCEANRGAADCFDKILGFISDRTGVYPNGQTQGYTYGAPANIIVASDEDAAATVAHEIAHNYGIGDAYDIDAGGIFHCAANPTPNTFKGKDWNDRTKTISCTAGKVPLEDVNTTKVPKEHHPYEVGGRGPLGDVGEFMGSSGPQAVYWTSQDAWNWIFDHSTPLTAPAGVRAVAGPQRLLHYFGYIKQAATAPADVTVKPWESFSDALDIADTAGPYMILAVDGSGRRLASQALTPEFDIPGSKGMPLRHLDPAPFEGVMRFPAGTTAFEIVRDGRMVTRIPVSPNAPIVRAVTPERQTTLNGPYVISWAASDADGDRLTYEVLYNPDITNPNENWEVLASDLDTPTWSDDFFELPGGNHAQLLVVASDGVNAGEAVSAEFVVPPKPPEVFIFEPADGPADEVVLDADTFDLQDGSLSGARLVWTSNISGPLGTGEQIVVRNLPIGSHTITLTATNSRGLTHSDAIHIDVTPETNAPFGAFDAPANFGTGAGEVAVTGWALDDQGVSALEIYRSAAAGEPTGTNGLVFVGNGMFFTGTRPDIATAYPSLPNKDGAGWGYMMLTNVLPNQGTGTFTLSAFAKDAEGQSTLLGTKTITLTNNTSAKPFGTLDTPTQRETISGTYTIFGWALTPKPNTIPTDGSTIDVLVDGVVVGHPVYNTLRSDIAAAFPGLNNSNGAGGYFVLNTETLANGVHTLSWVVRDSAGNVQGIGSRFVIVRN